MKKALLLCSVFILNGCSFLHFAEASLSKRNSESISDSKAFLAGYKVDTTFAYQLFPSSIDSLSKENYAINLYKLKTGSNASPVQLRMYKSSGEFVGGWELCYGNLKDFDIFDSVPFKKIKGVPINHKLNLESDLKIIKIENREFLQKEINSHDFVIILYWAKWTRWYTRDTLRRLQKYIQKYSKESSILLVTVNISP